MEEKVFKSLSVAGIWNLVLGITVLATGLVCGILLLVSGGRLLRRRKDVML